MRMSCGRKEGIYLLAKCATQLIRLGRTESLLTFSSALGGLSMWPLLHCTLVGNTFLFYYYCKGDEEEDDDYQ